MLNQPKFRTCEIVTILSTHPKKKNLLGTIGIVDEIEQGRGRRWRYKLILFSPSDYEYFYEEELETTGEFD